MLYAQVKSTWRETLAEKSLASIYRQYENGQVTGNESSSRRSTCYGAGVFLYGSGSVKMLGMSVPVPAGFFLTGAAASAIADVAHDYYDPTKPTGANKLSDLKTLAVGAAFAGVSKLTEEDLPMEALLPAFGLGAGTYIVGDIIEAKLEDSWNWYSHINFFCSSIDE